MIASWMLASTLFALLLGVAALAGERALRITGRQGRSAWLFALVSAVGWTGAAPAIASIVSRFMHVDTHAPIAASTAALSIVNSAPVAATANWVTLLDVPLVALWSIASLVMCARLMLAMRALSRMERAADREVIDGVPVLVTESIGPAVFGTRRARVLVPRWLLDLDAPLRELVLRHEQEHCRARDPELTLTIAVALLLMPWNAGVWWIARRLRLAVELDCDARVLRDGHDTERYSKLLLFIAQRQSVVRLAPMLAESNSHLERRITAMHATRPSHPRIRMACFAIVTVGSIAYSTKFARELTAAPTVVVPRTTSPSIGVALPNVEPGPVAREVVAAPVSKATAKRVVAATPERVSPRPPQQDTLPPDRNVMEMPGLPTPRYPDILKQAGLGGGVLVAFVVDTNGVADPESMKVFISTHELFTASVKAALPNMHFLPAILNGKKVKQVVRLPIVFVMVGSAMATEEGYRAVTEKLVSDVASSSFVTLGAIIITAVVP